MKLLKFSVFVGAALGVAGLWFSSCGHNGTLSSIKIAPANTNMVRGSALQFTATATFSDGTTIPWTLLTWSSSNTGIATVSNAAGSVGLVSALSSTGTTTITALDVANNISDTTTLTVAVPDSITVTPIDPGMAGGTSHQFTTTANFDVINSTPTTTQIITTPTVTWTTDDQTVATISPTGVVTTLTTTSIKTVFITANDLVDGLTDTVTLTVTPTALTSITVTPSPAIISIPSGTTQQFSATATYADATTLPRTSSMVWTSSNSKVATIDNTGLATAVTTTVRAATTITARDPITNIGRAVTLIVTPANLSSIAVTPASPSVAVGATKQFVATGTYDDGTTQNLTTQATWNSSDAGVATISNAAGSNGLATSVAPGSTTITATLGSMSGSTALTVTP